MKIIGNRDRKESLMRLIGIGRYINKFTNGADPESVEFVNEALAELSYIIGGLEGCLRVGKEIRCDKKSMVFYICDRKACDPCDNPDCKHTPKIEHAKNFNSNKELGIDNGYSDYWEVEKTTPEIQDGSSYFLTPENEEVTLAECPVGLFEYEGELGMKTEYLTKVDEGTYKIDAYIVSTGERFCIDNDTLVKPCGVWVAEDDEDGLQ